MQGILHLLQNYEKHFYFYLLFQIILILTAVGGKFMK